MERLRNISRYWPVMLCAIFYIYLILHAFTGRQGLLRWVDYERETDQLQAELTQLTLEREALEKRAARMDIAAMDMDWVEQQAREKLFYSHPKDITIWLDE